MTVGVWHFFATQVDGSDFVKILPSATVTVRRESDAGLANLESDIDSASPGLDNPFTVGADGAIEFYADDSERYRIDIVKDALTLTLRYQSVSIDARILRAIGQPMNLNLAPSISSSALTMAVKGQNGADPSATNIVYAPMRAASVASGARNTRTIAAPLSLTISSGSTLGHNSGLKQYIYWYLIDFAGAIELAASSKYFGVHGSKTTLAEGGAGAADSGVQMYSATARSDVPFLCIGYTEDTQTTAGTWATDPSKVHLAPFTLPVISFSTHKNGVDQTGVATATATALTWSTYVYNNGNLFDANKFTPPPGLVHFSANADFSASADTAYSIIYIYKNNAAIARHLTRSPGTANLSSAISVDDECNGTDFYHVYVEHNVGSNQIIDGTASHTYFTGSWSPGRS